jgi:hypothetical protein
MNDQMPPSPPMGIEEPRKNNTPIIIAVVVIVLLCCCCLILVGGWYLGDCLTNPNDPAVCPLAANVISIL